VTLVAADGVDQVFNVNSSAFQNGFTVSEKWFHFAGGLHHLQIVTTKAEGAAAARAH
jgi:hypothetical protein